MASAFAHAFAAASLGAAVAPAGRRRRVIAFGVLCSLLPDVDVLGFPLGVAYGDPLGHRGATHSLAFAALTAAAVTGIAFRGSEWRGLRLRVGVFLFVATASHGLFDAMTDGGLGVAFLWPFENGRSFLPFRPVIVSPIGVTSFFTGRALPLLWSELVFLALPWCLASAVVYATLRWWNRSGRRGVEHAKMGSDGG